MRTRIKEKTLPVLIGELDDVFSDFIRLRDSNNGIVSCFICGARMPWRNSQNMHYIDRAQMPTRYDEMNCHAGCEECNCFDPNHHDNYRSALILKHGLPGVQTLKLKSQSLQKFMRFELVELIESYKLKVKELKK